jgi:hypothetical protein
MGFLSSIFGSTPQVPTYTNTLTGSQSQAIASNQAALPAAEALASGVTSFNTQQLTSLLNQQMPGFSANSNQIQQNISSELQGKLPTDVLQNIQSSDAAQALTGGFGGSGLSGNMTAKDLGLTSLQLMSQGQSAEQSWSSQIDSMFAPGMGNVSSMFISPEQQFSANQDTWNAQWLANQTAAQPNPIYNGILNMGMQTQSSVLGVYGGGSSYSPIGGTGGSVSGSQMDALGSGAGPVSYGASNGDISGSLSNVNSMGGSSFLSGIF